MYGLFYSFHLSRQPAARSGGLGAASSVVRLRTPTERGISHLQMTFRRHHSLPSRQPAAGVSVQKLLAVAYMLVRTRPAPLLAASGPNCWGLLPSRILLPLDLFSGASLQLAHSKHGQSRPAVLRCSGHLTAGTMERWSNPGRALLYLA